MSPVERMGCRRFKRRKRAKYVRAATNLMASEGLSIRFFSVLMDLISSLYNRKSGLTAPPDRANAVCGVCRGVCQVSAADCDVCLWRARTGFALDAKNPFEALSHLSDAIMRPRSTLPSNKDNFNPLARYPSPCWCKLWNTSTRKPPRNKRISLKVVSARTREEPDYGHIRKATCQLQHTIGLTWKIESKEPAEQIWKKVSV